MAAGLNNCLCILNPECRHHFYATIPRPHNFVEFVGFNWLTLNPFVHQEFAATRQSVTAETSQAVKKGVDESHQVVVVGGQAKVLENVASLTSRDDVTGVTQTAEVTLASKMSTSVSAKQTHLEGVSNI